MRKEKISIVTKNDIISMVKNKFDCTNYEATQVTETILEYIIESIKKKRNVRIPGLGILKVVSFKAKNAYNPITKEVIRKEGGHRVVLHVEAGLKKEMRNDVPEGEKKATPKKELPKKEVELPKKSEKNEKKATPKKVSAEKENSVIENLVPEKKKATPKKEVRSSDEIYENLK